MEKGKQQIAKGYLRSTTKETTNNSCQCDKGDTGNRDSAIVVQSRGWGNVQQECHGRLYDGQLGQG